MLHEASCLVMVVNLPQPTKASNLVAWYETALQRALRDHPTTLGNLMAAEAMAWFPPPYQSTTGPGERRTAAQALERLANAGVLYRQRVQGESITSAITPGCIAVQILIFS
jgi:hypothetical protein